MDFRTARDRVSIEHLGYQYNKSKGRIRLQYEHPSDDKVIISNPHDNSRHGRFYNDQNGNMYDIMVEKRLNPNFDIEFKKDNDQIIAIHKGHEYRFDKDIISKPSAFFGIN